MGKVAGKRSLKIFLPVLAGMVLLLLCYRISIFIQPLNPERDGDGAMLLSNLVYFIAILFTIVLFLPQWIIVVPVWDKLMSLKKNRTLAVLALTISFAAVTGALIGFSLWQKAFGLHDLYISIAISSVIALFYFAGNLTTLCFLTRPDIADTNFDDDEME